MAWWVDHYRYKYSRSGAFQICAHCHHVCILGFFEYNKFDEMDHEIHSYRK